MTSFIKGFTTPIHDSQKTFRQVLLAMSEPGKWQKVAPVETIDMLNIGTVSLVLSLLDADTTLWLPEEWQTKKVKANLTFHSGCKITSNQSIAHFAIYSLAQFLAEKSIQFSLGNDRYPDQSTTIVIQLSEETRLYESHWQGPGIKATRSCHLPINEDFWKIRQQLTRFPCGIDFIFTQGDMILGLPRTTQVLR